MSATQKLAHSVFELLEESDNKIVLAESCTCGKLAGSLGEILGISQYLCGSFVTYRIPSKIKWLGVDSDLIEKHTAESIEVAKAMSRCALAKSPEADYSLGVVGHEDGLAYIAIHSRGVQSTIVTWHETVYKCVGTTRAIRLDGVVRACLLALISVLESETKNSQ